MKTISASFRIATSYRIPKTFIETKRFEHKLMH